MANLTIKQEKFAQKYIELGNASEAYRQSYNAENMSETTIHEKACIELGKDKVRTRVNKLKAMHAEKHAVTVESLVRELEEARALALQERQSSAAVSASMSKAKLHGLGVEKKEIKISPLEDILNELDGKSTDLPTD